MQAGDIVFVRGKTLMSRLIRFFDKGEFSHVCIAVSQTHVIEAQYGTRSRIVPFRFELKDCEIIRPKLTAVGLALKRWIDNQNAYICTEIIHDILKEIGYMCCPNDMTPNELYRFLKANTTNQEKGGKKDV